VSDAGRPGPGFGVRLVVTDLDHTLIENPSQIPAAGEALRRLADRGLVTVLASSKTFAEMEDLQRQAGLPPQPFIFENGGGIGWPLGQGPLGQGPLSHWPAQTAGEAAGAPALVQGAYGAIAAAGDLTKLGAILAELASGGGFRFRRFDELPLDTISTLTGLDPRLAALARQRLTSLPLLWDDSSEQLAGMRQALAGRGLAAVSGGRFVHVGPPCDKATALTRVRQWLGGQAAMGGMLACGDSDNDRGLLEAADIALVFSCGQRPPLPLSRPCTVVPAGGPGPWLAAVEAALESSQGGATA
jgi:mannosyl-3-phosphoglycerate phosphatase family protein